MAVNSHTEKNKPATFNNRSWESNNITGGVTTSLVKPLAVSRDSLVYMLALWTPTGQDVLSQPPPHLWLGPYFSPFRAISPCPSNATAVLVSSPAFGLLFPFASGWSPWLGPGINL